MLYVVQKNVFKETNYNLIFESLNRLGLEYEVVEFDSNGDVEVLTDRTDIFVFGSVRLARISTDRGWRPGSYYGGNHDFSVYSNKYGNNLLNSDSVITTVGDNSIFNDDVIYTGDELYFIRPCKDSKVFTGKLFTKDKWLGEINNPNKNIDPSTLIQVAKPKKIYKEARCWVVDGKIVTSSYYFFHGDIMYEENVEPEGLEFAQNMVKLFEVAPAFVMDICLTPDGWKIVEINCINCSGFYKGDLQKVLIALENKFNPQ